MISYYDRKKNSLFHGSMFQQQSCERNVKSNSAEQGLRSREKFRSASTESYRWRALRQSLPCARAVVFSALNAATPALSRSTQTSWDISPEVTARSRDAHAELCALGTPKGEDATSW